MGRLDVAPVNFRLILSTRCSVGGMRRQSPYFIEIVIFVVGILLAIGFASSACAQDGSPVRLMDQPPFDLLTLDKTNDSKVYKIYPARLPGRKIPEKPKPTEKLRVKLLEDE